MRLPLLFISLLLPGSVWAQRLIYTVNASHPESHRLEVILRPTGYNSGKGSIQFPAWAPGAYSMTHYGKYVEHLEVKDVDGKAVKATEVTDDRFEFTSEKPIGEIRYEVADSHNDKSSLYFALAHFDTSFIFANATALFGYVNDRKDVGASVQYILPEGWQLATPLEPTSPSTKVKI